MSLTIAQLQALKASAQGDATASSYLTTGDMYSLAIWLNASSPGAETAWLPQFTPGMARKAISVAPAGLAALTQGNRDALLYLLEDVVEATDANLRTSISTLCAGQTALINALSAGAQRVMTRAEKILATGSASPYTMTVQGAIGIDDVNRIPGA